MTARAPGLLALSLAALLLAAPAARAAEPGVRETGASLPQARLWAASAWDPRDRPAEGCPGGCAYLFGGSIAGTGSQGTRDILRFNPAQGIFVLLDARLPAERHSMAAVWNGSKVYLFGGYPETDAILVYDADTDVLETLPEQLPSPRHGIAAAWAGDAAYLFGGWSGGPSGSALADILRFDPQTGKLRGEQVRLGEGRHLAAAAWDGRRAYLAAGLGTDGRARLDVDRYNVEQEVLTPLGHRLPHGFAHMAWAADGASLYLLGGYSGGGVETQDIVRFDLAKAESETEPFRLPSARPGATAVWAADRLLLFGGADPSGGPSPVLEVVPTHPPPLPPPSPLLPPSSPVEENTGERPATAASDGPTGPPASPGSPTDAMPVAVGLLAAVVLGGVAWSVAAWRSRRHARPKGSQARTSLARTADPAAPGGAEAGASAAALRVEGVSVQHKGSTLHPVAFAVPSGSLTLLLGPSGAGKSSLLRAIVGLVPCQGRIQAGGSWMRPGDPRAKRLLGYVPQALQLHTSLTALANLAYFGAQFGLTPRQARERGRALLRELGLEEDEGRSLDQLSGGQQRRVSIAVALVHEPAILVLDEPTSGLDLGTRKALWMVLQRLAQERGVGVLTSSHFLDDAGHADQVGILARGRLVAFGPPGSLLRSLPGQGKCVEVEFEPLDTAAPQRMQELLPELRRRGLVEWAEPTLFRVRCFGRDPRGAARALPELLERSGVRVRSVRIDDVRLEDVFVRLAGKPPQEGP